MPIMECEINGKKGFKWGHHGTCYLDRKDAEKQAEAAHANGYTGDMALDASARTIDVDGRLHISKSHISKAAVNPYYGREIPGADALGLEPDKIYYLLRDPEELRKAAPTFARLPILAKHVPISSESMPQELIVGAIGSDVEFNHPYLDADLCFWTDESIAGIETKQVRELSCAYRYVPIMVPGIYDGQSYDGRMTNIIGNHLAQVESGRAGPDVFAADSKPEINEMKMTKLVAMDAEKDEKVMDSVEGEEEPEAKEPKKAAKDMHMDKKAKDSKKAKDADMDDEDDAPAQDEEEEEEEPKKPAKDKKAKDTKAMDAFKKELRDADEARRAVRNVVGDVIAQDSAESIYGFALDHMKVDHKDVKELAGLKALFTLANAQASTKAPAHIAQDSAGMVAQFPNAARFRQA